MRLDITPITDKVYVFKEKFFSAEIWVNSMDKAY
jgi:hypothetical protein